MNENNQFKNITVSLDTKLIKRIQLLADKNGMALDKFISILIATSPILNANWV